MALTSEEKKKIYEEEKARIEAQEKIKKQKKGIGCGTSFIIILVFMIVLVWVFTSITSSPRKSSSGPSTTFNMVVYNKEMKAFEKILFKEGAFNAYYSNPSENYKSIKINVSDDWYRLPMYMKERLITQIGQAYANIRIKSGVEDSVENFPEVLLEDKYGSKVAKSDTWGIKIYK